MRLGGVRKTAFGGPAQVLNYLGCYTHRVAISNHRLLSMADGKVTFRWKDYTHARAKGTMTLAADEFIRRFLLHVLPRGFQHIRHYGFLGNRYRATKLALCRKLIGGPRPTAVVAHPAEDFRDRYQRLTGMSLRDCPICGHGHMVGIETIPVGSHARVPAPDTS